MVVAEESATTPAASGPVVVKLVVQLRGFVPGQPEIIHDNYSLPSLPRRIGEAVRVDYGGKTLTGFAIELLGATDNEPAVVILRCIADHTAPSVVMHHLPLGWEGGERRVDCGRGGVGDNRRPDLLLHV